MWYVNHKNVWIRDLEFHIAMKQPVKFFTVSKKTSHFSGNWHKMEVVVTGEATVALLFNTINYVKFTEELEDLECADKT